MLAATNNENVLGAMQDGAQQEAEEEIGLGERTFQNPNSPDHAELQEPSINITKES